MSDGERDCCGGGGGNCDMLLLHELHGTETVEALCANTNYLCSAEVRALHTRTKD